MVWHGCPLQPALGGVEAGLIETFIDPYAGPEVAEIVAGHGRWTEHLLARAAYVTIVDVNQKCLDACAERFADEAAEGRLTPMLTRGSTMPSVAGQLADFVWSFDSFVHMDPEVVQGYFGEIARVLRPGGHAVIHHAGLRGWSLPLVVATRRLGRPGHIVQRLAGQGRWRDSGNRSPVSRDSVLHWALDAGLAVDRQTQTWGNQDQFDVQLYGDWITVLGRPGA